MSGQMTAFLISIGIIFLTAAAVILLAALKRDKLILPLLFGACACFIVQYLLFGIAYNYFSLYLNGLGGIGAEKIVYIPAEIAFSALFELLFFLLILGIGFRKRLRRRSAAAFGAGYWCFSAFATIAGQLTDAFSTQSMLFTGSELEIVATGLQLPLELPLYVALAVMVAQLFLLKKPRYLFYALFSDILFRLILATPQLIGVAMLVALGFLAMMSLLLVYYVLRSRNTPLLLGVAAQSNGAKPPAGKETGSADAGVPPTAAELSGAEPASEESTAADSPDE